MDKYLEMYRPDLAEFREKTMQFKNKELSVGDYKGFSGGFGSYAQKGAAAHMLRLRMPGGRLTKKRLNYIVEMIRKYNIDTLKLTTCQTVQMHNIPAEVLCEIIEPAWEAGFMTRGGGGDFPRNMMVSPLSGVEQGEYMDAIPYAEAGTDYLLQFIKTIKMPRKLKVCFDTNGKNEPHATFRDLGFVARPDGKLDVYIAGGLGNNPKLGVQVDTGVDADQVLYYMKAMVDTFVAYGNYENRGKARTRYMQETLGADGLKKAYLEKLAAVKEAEDLTLTVKPVEITKEASTFFPDDQPLPDRVIAQKQEGLYAVYYQPIGGKLAPEKAVEIYELIKDMDQVEIRITAEEGLYIINCNAEEASQLLDATSDGAASLFETSVACIGNSICQVGVGDSQTLLRMCVEAVRKENFADGVLPRIHISGCPSSCGTHQIGDIGFRGAVKRTEDGPAPAFAVFTGGSPQQGNEILSEMGPVVLRDNIPALLVELGKMISAENKTYAEWIPDHKEDLAALIAKYAA